MKKEDVTQSDEVHTESQEKHGVASQTVQGGPTEGKGKGGGGLQARLTRFGALATLEGTFWKGRQRRTVIARIRMNRLCEVRF